MSSIISAGHREPDAPEQNRRVSRPRPGYVLQPGLRNHHGPVLHRSRSRRGIRRCENHERGRFLNGGQPDGGSDLPGAQPSDGGDDADGDPRPGSVGEADVSHSERFLLSPRNTPHPHTIALGRISNLSPCRLRRMAVSPHSVCPLFFSCAVADRSLPTVGLGHFPSVAGTMQASHTSLRRVADSARTVRPGL